MARIRLLDGLRALAALLVLLSHVAFWTGASSIDFVGGLLARGDSGVAVFFALSAFLLLRPWFRHALLGGHRPQLRSYAVRRVARILPAYWLALAAVLLVASVAASTGGLGSAAKVIAHTFVLQGFTGRTYQSFTQTWSLTTELVFYACVPMLGALLVRLVGRSPDARAVRRLVVLLGALAFVGVLAQGIATAWTRHGSTWGAGALGTSVIGHAAWFSAGALTALLLVAREANLLPWQPNSPISRWARLVRTSPGTALCAAVVVYLAASSSIAGPRDLAAPTVSQSVAKEVLYAVFAGLLVAAATAPTTPGSAADQLGRAPVVHWLGDISYGIFLWHVLVLQVLFLASDRPLFSGGFWWVLVPVVALTVAMASLSAQLVEQPLLRRAHRATTRGPAARV